MAVASARIGATCRISAAVRSGPGSPRVRLSRAKARASAWAPARRGSRACHVLGEASASLMKVIATMPTAIAATRLMAASKTVCGASIWAIATIATV